MAHATIGKIDPFDNAVEDWHSYIERIEQYFAANDVSDEKRVPCLLSLIGSQTYGLLRSLTAPHKPSEKSYANIVEILSAHLSPKPLVIAERFRFHKRDQREGETISIFVADIRKLSRHCEFGEALDSSLRDRLVCGLRNESIQKRLLSERDLTFTRAIDIAVAMETAAKDASELQNQRRMETEIHKLGFGKTSSRMPINKNCHRCNGKHDPSECRFKEAICHNCSKRGHIRNACKSKPQSKKSTRTESGNKINAIESDDEYDSTVGAIDVFQHHQVGSNKRIWINVKINQTDLRMELDTGSGVSIISKQDYESKFSHIPLRTTTLLFKTYTGERITPVGRLEIIVEYQDQRYALDLYVVKCTGPPLFGRDWLKHIKLNWQEINQMTPVVPSFIGENVKAKLNQLQEQYKAIFQPGLGKLKNIKARLVIEEGCQPKFFKPRQVPYALKPKVEAELDELERTGILTKVNYSEWATPIVPVVKRNQTVRICGDFKTTVNPVLKVDQYPLPRIEDIFASLAGGQKFSKLDLRQAYLQCEVEEESRKLLTINTHRGLYTYNRLVFGIASAPAIWQRSIDQVLQGVPNVQCILDDMIITGKNDQDHLKTLETVFERLKCFGLRVNNDKCEFFKSRISFCGHEIDASGLHKTNDKIQSVVSAPRPQNQNQLRSLIGLIRYYDRFLPNIASILNPLNKLLGNNVRWAWNEQCEQAFNQAKELIASDLVLMHYDPKLPLRLACDASPYGLGAVVSHVLPDGTERPIAFSSRSLSSAEQNYAQIHREALALYWGVKKFFPYLYGRKFSLVTDHAPLLTIFHPEKGIPAMTAARLQRYALFLSGFNYTIEYRGTAHHSNCDFLSRLPLPTTGKKENDNYEDDDDDADVDAAEVYAINQLESLPVTSAAVRRETANDPTLSRVLFFTRSGWAHSSDRDQELRPYFQRRNEISIHQDCLMWGGRVIVPTKLRPQILNQLHEGHLGVVKMKSLARSYFWYPGLDSEIETLTKKCTGCAHTQNNPATAPLHTWAWPSKPWHRIHVDYCGPFLGHMFLVVVDAYSKWPEVICMQSTTSEKTIEALRHLFSRNGLCLQLVSDNGPQFTSDEFRKFMLTNGIKHIRSVQFHPASNGQAERFVQSMKHAMKSMGNDHGTVQDKLSRFLLAYRNAATCVDQRDASHSLSWSSTADQVRCFETRPGIISS